MSASPTGNDGDPLVNNASESEIVLHFTSPNVNGDGGVETGPKKLFRSSTSFRVIHTRPVNFPPIPEGSSSRSPVSNHSESMLSFDKGLTHKHSSGAAGARLRRAHTAATSGEGGNGGGVGGGSYSNNTPSPFHPKRSIRVITKELAVKPKRRNLKALSGLRTLATLWIVLGHFQQTAEYYGAQTFVLVLGRGFIPVCMYIVLSGFVTHYAYKRKVYDNHVEVVGFYARRVCRVLFTYYVSILMGLLDPLYTNHDALASDYPLQVVTNILLIQSWFELPYNDAFQRSLPTQPNPAGWTISTLLLSWILYPFLNTCMRYYNQRIGKEKLWRKLVLAFGVYLIAMIPCIAIYFSFDGVVSNGWFEFLYKFPPLRLADFCLGMVLSELVDDPACNSNDRLWRFLPDIALLTFGLIVCLVNVTGSIPVPRDDAESFLISGLSPLLGLILLGYSINSDKKIRWSFSSILEHPVFIEIGNWSFAVYCFQFTWFYMFEKWQSVNIGKSILEHDEYRLVAPYLMPYLLTLYFISAFWTLVFETPFARKVKIWSGRVFKTKHSEGETVRKLVVPENNGSGSSNNDQQQQLQGNTLDNQQEGGNLATYVTRSDPSLFKRSLSAKVEMKTFQSEPRSPSNPSLVKQASLGPQRKSSAEDGSEPVLPSPPLIDVKVIENDPDDVGDDRNVDDQQKEPDFVSASSFEALNQINGDHDMENQNDDLVVDTSLPNENGEEYNGEGEQGVDDDDDQSYELEIAFESDGDESPRYESDPEYENQKKDAYDYLPDTDSEEEIEVDANAEWIVNAMFDTALEVERRSLSVGGEEGVDGTTSNNIDADQTSTSEEIETSTT